MAYGVIKIEWEYGEKYGHVFYPKELRDFQNKLHQLDKQAIIDGNPLYVEIFFTDDSYIGIVIGHEMSCFNFGIFVSDDYKDNQCRTQFDSHYDERKEDCEGFFQYSFKGDHDEAQMAETLLKEQAFEALYHYIENKKFPAFIRLSKQHLIEKYIEIP